MGYYEIAKENFDIIAVITASFLALVLHAVGVIPETYILSLVIFLLSLHVLHELKTNAKHEAEFKSMKEKFSTIDDKLATQEFALIKPPNLLPHTKAMALKNKGEIWWFNLCVGMFLSDEIFETIFKPAIENKSTKKIISVMKVQFKDIWEREILPKISRCSGGEKVATPLWKDIRENIAFVMIDTSTEEELKEADISVWGEPFMAEYEIGTSGIVRGVTRYIIYVKSDSELIYRLKDIFNKYRYKA